MRVVFDAEREGAAGSWTPGDVTDHVVQLIDEGAVVAQGLGILRTDVRTYSARLSAGDRWGGAEPVFCMADGPEGAFCGYPVGHPGWHAEAGVDGLRWGDGDEAREGV